MNEKGASVEDAIRSGDTASIAAMMTSIERDDRDAVALVERLRLRSLARARRVIVSGPSGAGKSSLLREIARRLRARGERVGVLAWDPASRLSSGAFLGDRVRLGVLGEDAGLFVRSLALREDGVVYGARTSTLADLLDVAGFEWVFVETVGAGQRDALDPVAFRMIVLSPGQGDEVQMLKAGLLEYGDLYVVNKSEQPGARSWHAVLAESVTASGRSVDVLAASANSGEGVDEIVELLTRRVPSGGEGQKSESGEG